ncbi:glycoside hydrolase family 31 protein [Cyclobacterium sp. 1_MG-2023]|uniref:glycoside hydrolase family 31 protein n=1 Tax=Cyclobacterium sp. 1_MG-2023 TaxID=3062681 RepID=UPI0026E31CD2|nr:TIM-barrel domain-containing protein [Cyclobacterium sp. 1_MG-2023]MDO6436387.1 glycoside hydrolase family 31 protein [Cyclobacterium sp. 1_MG-2023]
MKYFNLWLLFISFAFASTAQEIHWENTAPGVWKGTLGEAEKYDLLTASGAVPNSTALAKLGKPLFPISKDKISGKLQDGKTYLQLPLEKGEEIYGFGLNFKTIHQRGRIMRLHVDHYGGQDNGRTHAPVPFYVTSEGYGVFINSSRYLDIYAGRGSRLDSDNPAEALDRNTDPSWTASPYSDAVEVLVPAGGVEFYIFAGPTMLEAVQRFNLFNGGGPIPPRWGLGFTQRVHRLYDQKQVLAEAEEFENKGFPLDFIGLEPGWQSKSYPNTFAWDPTRFPHPEKLIQQLKEKNISLNLWINPYVSPEADFYDRLKPYYGSHSVWAGAVPDLSIPEAQALYWEIFKKDHILPGVGGYKIDEVDGYDRWLWPDVAQFPSGLAAEQLRQTYGLLVQRQSSQLFRDQNRRTYGLVRASNGGGVAFPYVIYNDYYDHKDFITALINSGFSGLLWTPEARASKSAEEWLRRFQTVVFSPMAMINAWASNTKPWSYPEVADEIKEMALLRMKMMPYWYSSFAKYHFEGIPPFRAMQLESGFAIQAQGTTDNLTDLEDNPYEEAIKKELTDQYMAGPSLLVAPLFAGEESRSVVLPKGNWYDFYSGKFVGNGEIITINARMDQIPVFVKDGGIIPMMKSRLHAPEKGEQYDLEIYHYGTSPGHFSLYDDDGISYDYEKGHYSWREINVSKGSDGQWKGSVSPAKTQKPDNIGKIRWIFMTESEGNNPVK